MDNPKRPSDKSYSDVMNEWAAQRNLVKGDRSRLIHPPWDASAGARFFGYGWRIALITVVPAAIYLVMLRSHLQSKDFNTMISSGLEETLEAEQAEAKGSQWTFNGMLAMKSLQATGGTEAFYEELEARNLATRIPFGGLFKKEWILPRVSIQELSIALRSGGLGKVPLYQLDDDGVGLPATLETPKTGWVAPQAPQRQMRAGLGVEPDFKQLMINVLQVAQLNATWGSGPGTSGSVTGMQTNITRTTNGWVVSGNGGDFRQSWLDGMEVDKLSLQLGPAEANIEEAVFKRRSGGSAVLTGRMTLGELPEMDGTMQLDAVALQDLVPVAAAGLFTAEAKGAVKLTGSVNRSSGIRMEGDLEILSGRLSGLPVLKALHQLTNEDQFRLLSLRSGRVQFTTSGSETGGGLVVDIKDFTADCGPLAKLKGTLRHEQIRESGGIDGNGPVEKIKVSGKFQLGLPVSLVGRLKPAVAARFFKPDDSGWSWLEIPVDEPLDNNFSRVLAADLLKQSAAAP